MVSLQTCAFCHGPFPGRGDQFGQHICGVVTVTGGAAAIPERTPDGHLQVWLLYRPEPFAPGSDDDRSIHLWVRRADVFTSRERAVLWLERLIGQAVPFRPYAPIFPELWIGEARGQRWLLCPSPVDPPGGER